MKTDKDRQAFLTIRVRSVRLSSLLYAQYISWQASVGIQKGINLSIKHLPTPHKHLSNNYNISSADSVSVRPPHLLFTATHRTDAAVLRSLHPSRCTLFAGQAMSRNMTICAVATKTHEDGKITSARPAFPPSVKPQKGHSESLNPPPCAQPDRQRIGRATGQGTIYNPITILILFSDTTDLLPEGNPSCHFYA